MIAFDIPLRVHKPSEATGQVIERPQGIGDCCELPGILMNSLEFIVVRRNSQECLRITTHYLEFLGLLSASLEIGRRKQLSLKASGLQEESRCEEAEEARRDVY